MNLYRTGQFPLHLGHDYQQGLLSSSPYLINYLVWPNVVTNQIAETIDDVRLLLSKISKERFERWKISVNVREKCNLHYFAAVKGLFG